MRIDCIAVEDEPLAIERLKDYILKVPFLNLLKTFDNGIDAIEFLGTTHVDLLFLDIQMDGLSGVQLLESIREKPHVIITTAFDKYALKGFELNVSDYLLKPYTFERFMQSVARVHDTLNLHQSQNTSFIFIKTEYRLEKIFMDEILFIEGLGDYRKIHTRDKTIMTLDTFGDLEKVLPEKSFCRVHKSYLVSVSKIDSIERDRIRIGKSVIPVSATYKESFYRLVKVP
jgi:DNA-binding LytR/AlgR family response regulator